MSKKNTGNINNTDTAKRKKMMRLAENIAALGMLFICVSLMIPLFGMTSVEAIAPFKWIYSAGTLIYICARVASSMKSNEPMRLRRLRRMEFWAGVCFMVGAAFWFYQEQHLGPYAGPLAVIKNTILFTLTGAMVQIIASWLIYSREKKLDTQSDKKQDK